MFKNWKSWIGSYIVAGLIYSISQQAGFSTTTFGELFSLVVAIGAGFFYHKLKNRIKIKNETARIIVTFVILEMVAGLLIGTFANLPQLYQERLNKVEALDHGWTETTKALFLKQNLDACEKGNETFCTCLSNYLSDRYSIEEITSFSKDIKENNASPQAIKDASNYCLSK